jgi:hypothetical protein
MFCSWIIFPKALDYPISVISNIFSEIREDNYRGNTGINDIGGELTNGVVDIGGKYTPVLLTPAFIQFLYYFQ